MIKWLEDNPVGIALASACAGLVVISLLLGVIWSLPASAPGGAGNDEPPVLRADVAELGESEPLDNYAVITERPVFNETRLPVLDEALQGEGEEDQLADEEIDADAPELELAGVIITPSLRMVTLKQKGLPKSLVAFEGQPLQGDYGSWHVSAINERDITLSSGSGETLQLVLQVHDVKIQEPPKLVEEEAPEKDGESGEDGDDQPLSRAEEIRQRIAQRREELRRAAQEEEQDAPPAVDYKQAVQSMIKSSSKRKKEDDDSQ